MLNNNDLKDYQILGANMQIVMAGFGSFTMIASKFLLGEGIGTPDDNMIAQFDAQTWYPVDRILRVFDRIQAEFGNFTLRQVGMHVNKYVPLPPHVVDIPSAFGSLDSGYHFNHAKQGVQMFNPVTGEQIEGIGHYKSTYVKGTTKLDCESTSIYSCAFDEGMLIALAQRFKPTAIVTHDKAGCRARGGSSCLYHVSWK